MGMSMPGIMTVPQKIVLTGGPGAGKTSVGALLARWYPEAIVVVPEAATQVYRQLAVRWSELDSSARRDFQRRVLDVQREQERRYRAAHPRSVLLLDRGTVDGAAYWPDGPTEFFAAFGSTLKQELDRYDGAIWLQTTAAGGRYSGCRSNPCRQEGPEAAVALGEALEALWRAHARFERVGLFRKLEEKAAAVRDVLIRWGAIPPSAPRAGTAAEGSSAGGEVGL